MAKQTGLGDRLFIAGYDLSGDVASVNIAGGPALQDVTGLDKSAMERIGLVRDGSMGFEGFFNDATGQLHDRMSNLPTTDQHLLYCRGATAGNAAAACVAKQLNYDGTRNNDGSLGFTVDAQSNGYGVEWTTQLTAGAHSSTGAENLASVDFAAAGTNGLQAYLQVTEFTGTDATVTIEESSDDGGGDAFASLVAFTQVTAGPTVERVTVAGGVERYLRVAVSTSGGFTSMSFVVAVAVNATAVAF